MFSSLAEIFRYRALVQVLVARELKARYRGTLLGFLWSFVNPLVMMAIYVLVFSVYLRIDMDKYPAFLLSGLLAWHCFAGCLSDGTQSVIMNSTLIKNVQLPSQIFPLVPIGTQTVHFLLSLPLLVGLLYFYEIPPSPVTALLPVLILLQTVLAYGIALVLAAVAVRFRDLVHLVPNLLTVLFFVTPILYPARMIPERYQPLVEWNPLAILMSTYHDVLFAGVWPEPKLLGMLSLCAFGSLVLGLLFFSWRRESFASEI